MYNYYPVIFSMNILNILYLYFSHIYISYTRWRETLSISRSVSHFSIFLQSLYWSLHKPRRLIQRIAGCPRTPTIRWQASRSRARERSTPRIHNCRTAHDRSRKLSVGVVQLSNSQSNGTCVPSKTAEESISHRSDR